MHYDLPWNPNRLEQREGRVDRYGQKGRVTPAGKRINEVRTIRYFCPESPVDGVVLRVLLDKARAIHAVLGTHVPVPEESESVTEAVLSALFFRGDSTATDIPQMELGLEVPQVVDFHRRWDLDFEREKINRTRFAQRALKPEEVRRELEATDAVLGEPDAVRQFVLNAAQRLGLNIVPDRQRDVFRIAVTPEARLPLPDAIQFVLPPRKSGPWLVSFVSPTPENAEYLGRNHPFVSTLAQFLMEEALTKGGAARAARCGVIRTRAVSRLTTLLLLRIRYLVQLPERVPMLAEEVQLLAHQSTSNIGAPEWLPDGETLRLLVEAQPDANVPMAEKRERIEAVLNAWPSLQPALRPHIESRAEALMESHRRIRQAVALKVRNLTVQQQFPPDLLGVLVLQPSVGKDTETRRQER